MQCEKTDLEIAQHYKDLTVECLESADKSPVAAVGEAEVQRAVVFSNLANYHATLWLAERTYHA